MRFIAMAAAAFVAAAAAIAHARAPAPPAAPAPTTAPAAVPEAMPFDVQYGTPISLNTAHKAIMVAVDEAKKHNWKLSITAVDPAGNLVADASMNGTQYGSIEISRGKARASTQSAGHRRCFKPPSTPAAQCLRLACWR